MSKRDRADYFFGTMNIFRANNVSTEERLVKSFEAQEDKIVELEKKLTTAKNAVEWIRSLLDLDEDTKAWMPTTKTIYLAELDKVLAIL